jgi:plasmid stability protein
MMAIDSPYAQVISRKRKWTPVAVQKGKLVEGSEESIYRALALRTLELPVSEFLKQGLEKELPKTSGVVEALKSNILDEERHDQALEYVVAAHGTSAKAEAEGRHILKAWMDAPEHPILKAAILERSVFFVLLPFYRFNGDIGIRTTAADISRDEQTHVAVHSMVCSELGLKSTQSLNRLRRATVGWVVDGLKNSDNKYLDKDFWMSQSDSLYERGRAPGLSDTQRARMPAFFEASNTDLPQYG